MSIRTVTAAVVARLEADTALTGSVFVGLVTDRPDRYVALFPTSGHRTQSRLTGPSRLSTMTFTVHSVGSTADQAQAVTDHVFAQLLDWTPTVDGINARRLVHASSQPIQRDDDVSPSLFYCVDDFDLTYEVL